MADIAIYALVGAVTNLQERVANLRSPIIPLSHTSVSPAPPPIPQSVSRSADAQFLEGTLTEHGLQLAHYSWATRHSALYLRQCALKDAVAKNLIGCWAGLVRGQQGRDNLRAVRLAVDEAAWVEERLQQALDWCHERNVKRMKLVRLVHVRRGKRRCVQVCRLHAFQVALLSDNGTDPVRLLLLLSPCVVHTPVPSQTHCSSVVRPTHTEVPPSLYDLPFPLPLAPPSSRLAPLIPRPPPLLDSDAPDGPDSSGPPTYTREADPERGESTLEGGFLEGELEVMQYEAAVLDDDDVLEMLRMQHPRTS